MGLASVWTDVAVPLAIAFVAGTVAALWPWLQGLQRGRKFERIIRRELEEITPNPDKPVPGKPWWEHATKRFVHEEIFKRDRVADNRDFLLSLDPTVVYKVSQLWIALEKRDGHQWMFFLTELAKDPKVGSPDLRIAASQWHAVIRAQPEGFLETMGVPSKFTQDAVLGQRGPLFDKRFAAYTELLPLTKYGSPEQPNELAPSDKITLARGLTDWFYKDGGGLLLSGRALDQFLVTRRLLEADGDARALRQAFSKLRTDLKIDLRVRQPQEREVAFAWPEEERW